MSDALAVFPSVGGGFALVFIVGLAVGIAVLSAVFMGSAAVVVERLARTSHRLSIRIGTGVVAACVAALVGLELVAAGTSLLGLSTDGVQGVATLLFFSLVLTFVAMGVAQVLLSRTSPRSFETAFFGLAIAIAVLMGGGAGLPLWSSAIALTLGCGIGLLRLWQGRLRRSWRQGLGVLFLAALIAAGIGWLPAMPREWFSVLGNGLLVLMSIFFGLGLFPLAMAGLVDLRGKAEWFIAVRYLVARRRQVFISAITAICVIGIAAGVWLILVVLSVMNGFEETWREEILGHRAHFVVHADEENIPDYATLVEDVESVPGVIAVSPFVDADAMVRGRLGEIHGLRLRGVDPERIGSVTRLEDDLLAGSLETLESQPEESEEDAQPGILIGNRLALALGIDPGDSLLLIAPFGGAPTPLGTAPRLMRFRVKGIFRSSFQQYDEAYAYVSLAAAQSFARVGPVISGMEAITTDHYRSQEVGLAVQSALGPPFQVRDWKEYFPAFFQALKTERVMMFLLLTMIMVVAAFVIVATLMMMIMEKSGDIAILKAMGARNSLIERIFALEGTLIGVMGTFVGVVAALAVTHRINWIQDRIEFLTGVDTLPETVYQFSTVPSRIDPLQVLTVAAIALILSLGATLLPSRQGANLDPVEGLRHE
ncbi:MAG: FtsX-like permease family protein [Myxococcota bacterium]|nr:FtsX-like permease family protein [Myxococcota bacterium]